ncbi:30S ribosomal protein S10 [Candidatus Vidania fulgoroideorum]
MKIVLKSLNTKEINKTSEKIKLFLLKNSFIFSGPVNIPTRTSLFNILKSPHKDKDSRDQIGYKRQKKVFFVKFCFKTKFYKFLKQTKIPSDVNIKIIK